MPVISAKLRWAAPILVIAALAISHTANAQVKLNQLEKVPGYSTQSSTQAAAPPEPVRTESLERPASSPAFRAGSVVLAEGTPIRIRLEDQLSSATNHAGDEFTISSDDDIDLSDGTILPAGYRGRGEVVEAHKKEMLGKPGELDIRLDYIRIGATRVRLRATKSGEGRSGQTTTIVLSFLLTPLFLMHHGANVVFPRGQTITAYVDEDTILPVPVPPPPHLE